MKRRFIDLIGQKFGKLTVIKLYEINKRKQAVWECLCECGNKTNVLGYNLRKGFTKSCKCLIRQDLYTSWRLPDGQAAINCVYSAYRSSAKARNLEWQLTKDQCYKLFNDICTICLIIPSTLTRYRNSTGNVYYNGIDRIDSNKGYTIDNVQTMCKTCNCAKMTLSMDEFIVWIERIRKTTHDLRKKDAILNQMPEPDNEGIN